MRCVCICPNGPILEFTMDARNSALPHFNGAMANIATGIAWTAEAEDRQMSPTQQRMTLRHEQHIAFSWTGHRFWFLSFVIRQSSAPGDSPFYNEFSTNFHPIWQCERNDEAHCNFIDIWTALGTPRYQLFTKAPARSACRLYLSRRSTLAIQDMTAVGSSHQ